MNEVDAMLQPRPGWGIKYRAQFCTSVTCWQEEAPSLVRKGKWDHLPLPFSAKKSLLHKYIWQLPTKSLREWYMGEERKLMKVSVPKKREAVVSHSQKFETVLCRFLAMAGYAVTKREKKKKKRVQFQISCSCTSIKPIQSPLTVQCCVAERQNVSSSQALIWCLTDQKAR